MNFRLKSSKPAQPLAKQGRLDLSGWDFSKNGAIRLDGEWEFYWNQLLTPEDFNDANKKTPDGYIKVPSEWKGRIGTTLLADKGAATYRLKVNLGSSMSALGIQTTIIRMSNRIFIDGNELLSSGNPALSKKDGYVMANTSYSTSFYPNSREVEIIVQVANFDYMKGGIVQSIYLGNQKDIYSMSVRSSFLISFTVVGLFITGLYYFFLFLMRQANRSALYYSLYCFTFSLFRLQYGEKILFQMFENLSNEYVIYIRFYFAQIYLTTIFLCLFVKEIAKEVMPRWFSRTVVALFSGFALIFLIFPISISSKIQNMTFLFMILIYVVIILTLIKALVKKRYENLERSDLIQLSIAFICVLLTVINSVFYVNNVIRSNLIGFVTVMIFIVITSSLISRQHEKAFQTIDNMNLRLLELDKLKDEFLTNTSHELKTPLNGIINLTQSVINQGEGQLEPSQEEDLKLVIAAGRRLSALINDILDISCLKQGEVTLLKKPIDVRSLASVIIHVMEHLKEKEEIRFINSIPEHLPLANADEARLQQIYYNLLGNALKFTQKGSIEVGGQQQNGMLALWVKDTGCGIPHDKLDDLFQPFYQVDPLKKENQGAGLGLSITKQLIELHGGNISVDSIPEKGTKVTFTLPVCKDDVMAANPPVENLPPAYLEPVGRQPQSYKEKKGSYSILIAEDDPISLRALLGILAFEDYSIKTVYDGEEALEEIKKSPCYDLAILDVMMPKLTGYQVLEQIRTRFTGIELPVILLTAKARAEDIKMGFEAGANDYIAKPFEAEELKSRVRTLVQMRKMVQSLVSTEFSFLKAQIKPHFLYNALSVITSLSTREPEKAKELLLHLSDYLRGSFHFENHNGSISLSAELQTVESYLAIEKARFKDRLKVEYEIEDDVSVSIPILSLQPLVENAVRHGIMSRIEGGTVKISVKKSRNKLLLTVEDDGVGMSEEKIVSLLQSEETKGVGIKNIHKRMVLMYGEGLHIESREGKGTKITMAVPLNTE
ncbi:MAG: ATP-binding protein [Lacrimispora sp.]|uniref:hybrid sensor histidine kinase/response regulator n=1 Tax=Lacrimispora sp. TaxID=2719234 RepID=UPI0039E6D2C1